MANVLKGLRKIKPLEVEIIIVDDGSTDGSHHYLKAIHNPPHLNVIFKELNSGKGSAIKEGFHQATGDYVLIQDADMEYDPMEYESLLKPVMDGSCKVVFGSRFKGKIDKMNPLNRIANIFLTTFTNLLYKSNFSDVCTAYKMFPKIFYKNVGCKSKGFEICHELVAEVSNGHWPLIEVPIKYEARTYKEGKKVTWTQLFKSALTVILFRKKCTVFYDETNVI